MEPSRLKKKKLYFVLIIAYFVLGYFFCNLFNMDRSSYFDVALPFEADIPFIPFFILGYISVYASLIILYAAIDDYDVFIRAIRFFFILSTVHFILFLLIPVRIDRPDLAGTTGIMNVLTRYYYLIDNPVNCFPSLHVAYPLGGTLVMWNYKRPYGYVMAIFTAWIAVSVVLVKQHYIMDIAGAVVATFFCYAAGLLLNRKLRASQGIGLTTSLASSSNLSNSCLK